MEIVLESITQKKLSEFRNIMREEMIEDKTNVMVKDATYIEAFIVFLHLIKHNDQSIMDALTKVGIVKKGDIPLTPVEKGIRTIAAEDYIDKLINPDTAQKARWHMTRLKSFAAGVSGSTDPRGTYWVKTAYKRFQAMFRDRQNRVKKSPKVQELADAYPDINVHDLVTLGVLRDKVELTQDDLRWIEEIILLFRVRE